MTHLETRRLTLATGNRILCRELDVRFNPGENWVILGANGSGKTTLLHTLAGLRAPTEGHIHLDGRDLRRWSPRERARTLALLFQDYPPTFTTTVLATVLSGRHPHRSRFAAEAPEDYQVARAALSLVDLVGMEMRDLATLSGGERRRVEIAATLAQDPFIGLWDEPANSLDLRHQNTILNLIAQRALGGERLNLFVLHDVNVARRIANRALLLFPGGGWLAGQIENVVTPETLRQVYGCHFEEIAHGARLLYITT